jgi:hypothetical protein
METDLGVSEPDDSEPEDLTRWLAAGFERAAAEIWRRWHFTIGRAQAWEAVGVTEGLHAAQWSTAGVTPDTVDVWRAAGIDATEAVRWHEFGFGLGSARAEKKAGMGPEQAFARMQHQSSSSQIINVVRASGQRGRAFGGAGGLFGPGVDPRISHSYREHQWTDESAVAWAEQGIVATDAYLWHDLGLTAGEAGRLTLLGRTVGDVVREWWTAGVPFEEFADWIGAGLTAAEAVEQRARGITAEHAASLRALRADEAPDPAAARERRRHQRTGPPRVEKFGPPPADEAAARAAIMEAYAAMGEPDDVNGTVPSVEGSEGLAVCRQQATERARMQFGHVPQVEAAFSVDHIRFINDHEAVVIYTVHITGELQITLGDRPGRAIVVDGQWKVTRETFCAWVQTGGIECPPRQGPPPT